jgi:hypothetical protein
VTATDPRTLDEILATTEPKKVKPFDLMDALHGVSGRVASAWGEIAAHIADLNATIEAREHTAINLEADAARIEARVKESLALLRQAESWATDENSAGFISEAIAALNSAIKGDES